MPVSVELPPAVLVLDEYPAGALLLVLVGGNGTKLSVCVAFAVPVLLKFAVTGIVPSAMFTCWSVRLNSANEPIGW